MVNKTGALPNRSNFLNTNYFYIHKDIEYKYYLVSNRKSSKDRFDHISYEEMFYLLVEFKIKRKFLFFKFNHMVILDNEIKKTNDVLIGYSYGKPIFDNNKVRVIVLRMINKYINKQNKKYTI